MSTEVDDFLAHYGVKGMRWGKRGTKKGPVDKEKLKSARKEIYGDVKKYYNNSKSAKVTAGAAVATSLLTGGTTGSVVVGVQMMRGAGFSKGKSIAMGALGGAPGAALAIELKARKMARE
jgi:hypothetical protein